MEVGSFMCCSQVCDWCSLRDIPFEITEDRNFMCYPTGVRLVCYPLYTKS